MLDTDSMDLEADIGDMEPHYMFVESGPAGITGPNKPHRFMSLSRLAYWLKEKPQRDLYGKETDMRWFRKMLSFVGILRHEDTKGRTHAEAGNVCQLFSTGFKTRCVDLWQGYENKRNDIGPENGDLLQVLWRRVEYKNELDSRFPSKNQGANPPPPEFAWQPACYYSKTNQEAPQVAVQCFGLPPYASCGGVDIVGRVGAVYGCPTNIREARAIARRAINAPTANGSYKRELLKLRQLEVSSDASTCDLRFDRRCPAHVRRVSLSLCFLRSKLAQCKKGSKRPEPKTG
jgi:hypothetical protein